MQGGGSAQFIITFVLSCEQCECAGEH